MPSRTISKRMIELHNEHPQVAVWNESNDLYGRSQPPDWRNVDWSEFHVSTEVQGLRLHHVDLGENSNLTPCLFLHGIGNSWHFWLEVLGAIGQHRRVIALDLPGFGASSATPHRLSAAGVAPLVDAFCEQLGLDRVIVCGHSLGAVVGLALAAAFPARIERLLIVGGSLLSVTDFYSRPLRTIMRSPGPLVTLALGVVSASVPSPRFIRRMIANNRLLRTVFLHRFVRYPSRIEPKLLEQALSGLGRVAVINAVIAGAGYEFRDAVGNAKCPVHILNGADDRQSPVRDVLEFARLRPSSDVVLLENTGHWPMIERPRVFAQWLERTLSTAEGPPAPGPPGI